MYLDGGMGGGGWLLTSFFSIIYILGLVCYKHTIHVCIKLQGGGIYQLYSKMTCTKTNNETIDNNYPTQVYIQHLKVGQQ